jgi:cytochrome c peroxidase
VVDGVVARLKKDRGVDLVRVGGSSRVPRQVSNEIKALVKADPDKGPTLVRLAWHASGTYDKMSKDGGSNGGTIRFTEELAHGANAGLPKAIGWLEPIKDKHGALLSYADL